MAQAQRIDVHFSGRVQGVGFRYTSCNIARNYDVTGYVQNLPDGRVRLVAEGEPRELETFLYAVQSEMGRLIRNVQKSSSLATGGFVGFSIQY